jgi:carboxyl-terminal processing protease
MLGELKTSHLRVDHEIRMSGKTLKNLFGDNINYKQNDIIFDYGYSTAKFGKLDVVTNVDSPAAAQAGLKPGWVIKSCDTQPLTKKVGDSLFFTETSACVFLDESNRERALTLSPSWYLKPRAATQRVSKVLDGNVLYLKFNSFSDKEVGKWIKNEVDKNLSAKAVIVDLRGNHGGLITELKETLSPFFPAQSVSGKFIERDSDEKTFKFGSDNYYKGKVIVLINGESTSAAEIFASIVQESGRGQIVGQKSGGKVLNGITKGLSNDLKLYVAIRDYKTAKGFRLEDRGVTPDVEIPFSIEHFQKQTDVALAKALEILKN